MAAVAFQPVARIVKALALADLLDAAGIGASDAATMHPGEWRLLAQAAQSHRPPSEQTRELVLEFLRRREAARTALACATRTVHFIRAGQAGR
jgi:hypothetical protein